MERRKGQDIWGRPGAGILASDIRVYIFYAHYYGVPRHSPIASLSWELHCRDNHPLLDPYSTASMSSSCFSSSLHLGVCVCVYVFILVYVCATLTEQLDAAGGLLALLEKVQRTTLISVIELAARSTVVIMTIYNDFACEHKSGELTHIPKSPFE